MMPLCLPQIWYSSVPAPLEINAPTLIIGWQKCDKLSKTRPQIVLFRSNLVDNHMTLDVLKMFKVKWSKVKVTARERRLIVKLLLFIGKLGSLTLWQCQNFLIGSWWDTSLCAGAVQNWPKQPRTSGTTSGGLKLQCICNRHLAQKMNSGWESSYITTRFSGITKRKAKRLLRRNSRADDTSVYAKFSYSCCMLVHGHTVARWRRQDWGTVGADGASVGCPLPLGRGVALQQKML